MIYENGDTAFHAPARWEESLPSDAVPDDMVICPVCGAAVPDDLAGRVCPVEGCYPLEAGGWL